MKSSLRFVLLAGLLHAGTGGHHSTLQPAPTAPSQKPIVVDVWPGAAPDDIGVDAPERSYIHDSFFV